MTRTAVMVISSRLVPRSGNDACISYLISQQSHYLLFISSRHDAATFLLQTSSDIEESHGYQLIWHAQRCSDGWA